MQALYRRLQKDRERRILEAHERRTVEKLRRLKRQHADRERNRRQREEIRNGLRPIRHMKRRLWHSAYDARKFGYEACTATPEQLLSAYTGQCHMCNADGIMNLDHCHKTGEFRGWLCTGCNRGLGYFGDDLERLKAAIRYLEVP